MKWLIVVGVVLLACSAKPLVLIGRELMIGFKLSHQYSLVSIWSKERGMSSYALAGQVGQHSVQLSDDLPWTGDRSARVVGSVKIIVDGKDLSSPASVIIRPAFTDDNRYAGYVHLLKLIDNVNNTEEIVVSQNIGRGRYRVVSVSNTGSVIEETFSYEDRCAVPLRAMMISFVVPRPAGYCSDIMQTWPTLFVPVLFPCVSGGLGIVFLIVGMWRVRRAGATR